MRASLIFGGCLLSLFAFAQSPTDVFDKAPPETEKALRERAAIFFQAHVDGKFRRAEQVIHEDSLDDFYNSEKTHLIRFEISRIKWLENFTKAEVVADVELDWVTSRGIIRVKPPMKSYWTLDKGQWWWYVKKTGGWETPFGTMKSSTSKDPSGAPAPPPQPIRIPDAQTILNQVTADKSEVQLASAKKSDDAAAITSQAPGEIRLEIVPFSVPGLTVKLDKQKLKKGETAHLSFVYDPPEPSPKTPRIVYVKAAPLEKVFSFTTVFSAPQQQAPSQAQGQFPKPPQH